jgi:hypothetical protein
MSWQLSVIAVPGDAFLVVLAGNLESHWLTQDGFERRDVPVRRPELELRVARRAQPREVVVAAWVQVDSFECLRVAAIEPFGESNHGG